MTLPIQPSVSPQSDGWSRLQLLLLGLLALLILVPVTMPVPVLRGFVLKRFAVSEFQTSLFMAINMIGAFLGAPIAGLFSDYFRRRKWLIVVALGCDALCFWIFTWDLSFTTFLFVRFLEGIAHIVALSLLLAFAIEGQPPERHGRTMGLMGGGLTLGVALGAPLGGVIGRSNPMLPIQLGIFINLFAAALVLFLFEVRQQKRERPTLSQILQLLHTDKWILVPLAFHFIDRFTVGFFTATFSLYMKRIFDLPPPRIGFLLACFLLPFSLLSYPFGRISEKYSRTFLLSIGSLFYGMALMTLGWWTPNQLPYLMVILGTASAVMFVPSLVMVTDLSGPKTKATALGSFNAAGSLGFMLGPLFGGWVSQTIATQWTWHSGYAAAFLLAGSTELLCVLLTLPFLFKLRGQGRTT